MLRLVPLLVSLTFAIPIVTGVLFTFLPAFGYPFQFQMEPDSGEIENLMTEAAQTNFFLDHLTRFFSFGETRVWYQLLSWPGFFSSVKATFISGFGASLISFLIALSISASLVDTPWFARILRLELPFLALSHAALAVGLVFLIAPAGWIFRLLSSVLGIWALPPDLPIPHDRWGGALMLGLVIKELPFLIMVTYTSLNQIEYRKFTAISATLGYKRITSFWFSVFPQIYGQLRLPLFAVLSYSLSVVDMALILGPGNPPTLAVQVMQWFNDPDFTHRPLAAAGAMFQLFLILASLLLWRTGEFVIKHLAFLFILSGKRNRFHSSSQVLGISGLVISLSLACFSLFSLVIWTFAQRWRYPAVFPQSWSLKTWTSATSMVREPLLNSLFFAFASASIALVLAVLCLEFEQRRGKTMSRFGLLVLYLPLLIPQVGFVFGVRILAASLEQDGQWWTLLWSHLIFVLPYVLLTLSRPFGTVEPRYAQIGRTLGYGPWSVLWFIKLPLVMPAILFSFSLGFAVSFTQYLPTLVLGSGRFPSLTTEAVALASGADRRVLSVYAALQAVIPLGLFLIALALGRKRGVFRDIFSGSRA